ncbi:MAG: hypothetical protein WB919_22020 [Candidatus Sulfotelmatobacter sp.]
MTRKSIIKTFATALVLSALSAASAWAQSQIPAPQTARQAVLEMFSLKSPGTFVKHLPAVTLSALEKSGALQTMQQYSTLASQFHTTGNQLETFETGPVLLASYNPKTDQKVEVVVENDSLQGDNDNIELTFRTYKDKQPQRTPFMPRLTFAMRMESGVWKLNEILVSIRVPLADPDFLKSITEGMKSRAAAPVTMQSQGQPSTISFGADASVTAAMRTILTAENTYANSYRAVGYTCTLSDLDGFGGGEANEHQAMLIASGLAGGRRYGYTFTLSGCTGTPATGFHLAATPAGNSFGRRAFCADQSGALRYSADGNAATCVASGIPLP